ncbi:MAG: hypothetical protein ABI346_00800 [Candidatus Baltobacteraceae bacterium]
MSRARRVLFVSNGHGEAAISGRIAREMTTRAPNVALDHFPLVGLGEGIASLQAVGPRRTMPSGGLVAMGNVRAFAADVRAGFLTLFAAQVAFLRSASRAYDLALAVGDAYALAMTLLARLPTLFVGTAKSAYVAPYGPFERLVLRAALRAFVRDEPTAVRLRAEGVRRAEAPGNVIVDLLDSSAPAAAGRWIGILPGSRAAAYREAVRLGRVLRALSELRADGLGGLLSVAPGLDPVRFGELLAADGWTVGAADASERPFIARAGEATLVAWRGSLGALLRASILVLGQAGTANEAAAAFGLPVVALDDPAGRAGAWYRMRQKRLLGDALALIPPEPPAAARALTALLDDPVRLQRMREAGPHRLGPPGGAAAIAGAALTALGSGR